MSDEDRQSVSEAMEELHMMVRSLRKVVPFVWVLLGGAFALGGWVATLEYRSQQIGDVTQKNSTALEGVAIWKAGMEANRFTSNDAARMVEMFQASLNGHDKRIQRTEDALIRIEGSLLKIENKLDDMNRPQ